MSPLFKQIIPECFEQTFLNLLTFEQTLLKIQL